ncbi:MAG: hypothetical protein PHV82_15290 [Victivallaceae bacterium]|nr:hypothetical protein [Victivallaceae bacterium]
MVTEKEVLSAFKEACKKYDSQSHMNRITKVPQSTINDIWNGNKTIGNITVGNFLRLFPDMEINFFGSGQPLAYPEKILKQLNRLSDSEQQEVYEAIIACYPHVQDNKMIKKIKGV